LIGNSKKQSNKIIFFGLAESGKSTIINIGTKGKISKHDAKYSATIDYERKPMKIFEKAVILFDLGGQETYLKRFLGEMAEFIFSDVQVFIYVIDIANPDAIPLSKSYFDLCLKKLNEFSPKAIKYAFLHKIDLIEDVWVNKLVKNIEPYFLTDLSQRMKFCATSIYNNSISIIMSDISKHLE